MRFIAKAAEPRALIQWKTDNAQTPQNLFYGAGGFPAEAVREALLQEQFHLCAYTMRRLQTVRECKSQGLDARHACHIEHVLPQARKAAGEAIDYQNMVACYPPSDSSEACAFGAKAKDNFDPATGGFISPLLPTAEQHFSFDAQGGVSGRTADGVATIKVLRLDHQVLVNDRAAVIQRKLAPGGKPLSAAAARRLASEIQKPDAHQCLPAYCVAIAQAALAHAERVERRAARLKKRAAP